MADIGVIFGVLGIGLLVVIIIGIAYLFYRFYEADPDPTPNNPSASKTKAFSSNIRRSFRHSFRRLSSRGRRREKYMSESTTSSETSRLASFGVSELHPIYLQKKPGDESVSQEQIDTDLDSDPYEEIDEIHQGGRRNCAYDSRGDGGDDNPHAKLDHAVSAAEQFYQYFNKDISGDRGSHNKPDYQGRHDGRDTDNGKFQKNRNMHSKYGHMIETNTDSDSGNFSESPYQYISQEQQQRSIKSDYYKYGRNTTTDGGYNFTQNTAMRPVYGAYGRERFEGHPSMQGEYEQLDVNSLETHNPYTFIGNPAPLSGQPDSGADRPEHIKNMMEVRTERSYSDLTTDYRNSNSARPKSSRPYSEYGQEASISMKLKSRSQEHLDRPYGGGHHTILENRSTGYYRSSEKSPDHKTVSLQFNPKLQENDKNGYKRNMHQMKNYTGGSEDGLDDQTPRTDKNSGGYEYRDTQTSRSEHRYEYKHGSLPAAEQHASENNTSQYQTNHANERSDRAKYQHDRYTNQHDKYPNQTGYQSSTNYDRSYSEYSHSVQDLSNQSVNRKVGELKWKPDKSNEPERKPYIGNEHGDMRLGLHGSKPRGLGQQFPAIADTFI